MSSDLLARLLKTLPPAPPKRRISVALAYRGHTQAEMGASLAIDHSTLSRGMNGVGTLTAEQQESIAGYLEVPTRVLFQEAA